MAACLLALVGAVAGYLWHLQGEIHRVGVKNLSGSKLTGEEAQTENILIVGSTDRCGLKIQSPVFGSCAAGVNGINSDVVMILHLNAKKKTLSLLSIPRDTFIPNARSTGPNKIDAGLYEGPSQLVDAIQSDFGIPIRHYVELNFDGFQGVVDALGGVRMYFPEPVYDANSGLDVASPGCQLLDGYRALEVVRARHLQYKPPTVTSNRPSTWPQDPESDLSRIRRDHEFLRVLASAVAKKGLDNPLTDQALLSSLLPQMRVDQGFSVGEMVDLVTTFHQVKPTGVPQYTLPVSVDPSLSFLYDGVNYGSVALPVQPQDAQIIDRFLGVSADTDTMTGARLARPGSLSVTVSNGTGETMQATTIAHALGALGFEAAVAADATHQNPLAETVVYYASPSQLAGAEAVLRTLTGPAVVARNPKLAGAGVTVLTGSDLSVAPPATESTTPPTTAPSTDTADTLPAPNPATTTLAPFDPRSCTPSGGEGP